VLLKEELAPAPPVYYREPVREYADEIEDIKGRN
jgi:hypothetical protein